MKQDKERGIVITNSNVSTIVNHAIRSTAPVKISKYMQVLECTETDISIVNTYNVHSLTGTKASLPYLDNPNQKKFKKTDKRFTKPKKRRK